MKLIKKIQIKEKKIIFFDPNLLSINEKNTNIKLYPNPCQEYFVVEKNNIYKKINEINIYNLKGELIKRNFTKC